jgi:hypothetical protein
VARAVEAPDIGLPVDRWPAPPVRVGWHPRSDRMASRELCAPAAAVMVLLAGGGYLAWRATTLAGTGVLGAVCYAAEVALYLVVAGLAVLTIRVNRRYVRQAPAPAGTLDVFVTVQDQPVADIERTVRSVLAVTYPHRTYLLNDARIAGHGDWRTVEALADRLDVVCLTRGDGPVGRAASLNHALSRTDGAAVLTVDTGDLVSVDAADQVLGYLRDPDVGFVATPRRVAAGPGGAPGAGEPVLGRVVDPARDRDRAAVGRGSGTLYRRTALETVDGFGGWGSIEEPSTSYELHAVGWASVQHGAPITVRVTQPAAAQAARIAFAVAVGRLRMLLFDNPVRKAGLRTGQRVHYLCDAASPLPTALQTVLLLGPALIVFGGGRLAHGATAAGWLAFGLPYLLAVAAFGLAAAGVRAAPAALAGWLAAVPLNLLAVARVAVLGGRPDPGPAGFGGAGLGLAGLADVATRRLWARGRSDRRPAVPPSCGAFVWSPLLLPVSLIAATLGATTIVCAVRPDLGHLGPLCWAAGILVAIAAPVASSLVEPARAGTVGGRLRVATVLVAVAAVVLALAFGR